MKGIGLGNSGAQLTAPAYAPNAQGVFDPVSSRYNLKSGNKYQTRLAIGQAGDGLGMWDCCFIGDSADLGYNGTGLTQDTSKQWTTRFMKRVAALAGVANVWDGCLPLSGQDDRTVLTGLATRATSPSFVFSSGVGTSTTVVTGTDIWISFYNGNTATATVQVDGGAAVNLIPGGGTTIQTVHVATGLANAAHTVVINYVAGGSQLVCAISATGQPAGFRASVLSLGGSSAAFPTSGGNQQYLNWSDQTNTSSLLPSRLKAMADAGIVPQTYFIGLGSNDDFHSVSPATVSTALDYIESQIPNAPNGQRPDIFYVLRWNVTPRSAAQFQPMQAMYYGRADANNRGMWDWNDAIGGLTQGINYGAIGADLIHPTYPNMEAFADGVAIGFMA